MNPTLPFEVAVVIPLYNKAPYIRRTLESVLAQTLAAAEIIIVDDGSTDDSVARISDLAGATVRLVEQPNAGPGPARNRGVAEATAPWIAFLDGDDLWRPDHLATLAELSGQFPEADAVATGFDIVPHRDLRPPLLPSGDRLDGALIDYFQTSADGGGIWTSCVAVKRSAFTQTGDFGAFWPGEDCEYWTRLALDHPIALSKRRTVFYVQQTGGLMETFESGPSIGFKLQPIFATLDRALADPRYEAKHAALRNYRASLLRQNIRQALYRGEVDAARLYIAELEKAGPARLGLLRLLSWLPAQLLRAGMAARKFKVGERSSTLAADYSPFMPNLDFKGLAIRLFEHAARSRLGRRFTWKAMRAAGVERFEVRRSEDTFAGTCRDDMIAFEIFTKGHFDRDLVDRSCDLAAAYAGGRGDLRYIDIGANLGSNSVYALHHRSFSSAVCFEPDPANYLNLLRTIEANGLKERVRPMQVALGAARGSAELELSGDNLGDHRIAANPSGDRTRIRIAVERLDDLLSADDLANAGLVSLDVQGFEAQVLEGAALLLAEDIPILCELTPHELHRHGDLDRFFEIIEGAFCWFSDIRETGCHPITDLRTRASAIPKGGHADLFLTKRPSASRKETSEASQNAATGTE